MRIVVITPTRGDRPQFMEHCRWLVGQQTLQPDEHIVVDYPPVDDASDYYDRALEGLRQAFRTNNETLAMFFEDDDYYRNDYIRTTYNRWTSLGKPVVCGASGRYIYNILSRRYLPPQRSSIAALCQTAVTEIPESLTRNRYLDAPLWAGARTKATFDDDEFFTSIKHNVGLCNTAEHSFTMEHGKQDDSNMSFLKARVDPYSFEFYQGMSRG